MAISKKLTWALLLTILALILKEMPYINLLVVKPLWLFYLVLIFLFFFPLKVPILFILTILLLALALAATFYQLTYFAELAGLVIYFLLWFIAGLKVKEYLQKTK